MKTRFVLVFIALMAFSTQGYSQIAFGVSPGIGLNSAYVGYKLKGKIVPYIGFQYLNAKFKYEENGERYNPGSGQVESYTETVDFSGSLFLPNLGVKYFFLEKNKMKAYGNLSLAKPILKGSLKYDDEEDDDFRRTVEGISLFGAELGFGVEYFMDDNFSIGGEFGLRYLRVKYEDSYETTVFNPNTGTNESSDVDMDYRVNMSPTFSKFSLNFYF